MEIGLPAMELGITRAPLNTHGSLRYMRKRLEFYGSSSERRALRRLTLKLTRPYLMQRSYSSRSPRRQFHIRQFRFWQRNIDEHRERNRIVSIDERQYFRSNEDDELYSIDHLRFF